MKPLKMIAVGVAVYSLTACIVAPPHARYGVQAGVNIAVPVAPVPQPYYYPQPTPAPVVVTPWFNPFIGLNFWWGGRHHGHHR